MMSQKNTLICYEPSDSLLPGGRGGFTETCDSNTINKNAFTLNKNAALSLLRWPLLPYHLGWEDPNIQLCSILRERQVERHHPTCTSQSSCLPTIRHFANFLSHLFSCLILPNFYVNFWKPLTGFCKGSENKYIRLSGTRTDP